MNKFYGIIFSLILLQVFVSCQTTEQTNLSCDKGRVQIKFDFEGAGKSDCLRTGPAEFELEVTPEALPINSSAWYAFDIVSRKPVDVKVTLKYTEGYHRYHPVINTGDGEWKSLPADNVTTFVEEKHAIIELSVSEKKTRIAAQELFNAAERAMWFENFASRTRLPLKTIGLSSDGHPIYGITTISNSNEVPLVIILGGQHPPEVPGTLGLRAFLNELFGENTDPVLFNKFKFMIVPDINPDGINRGYWRYNAGLTDMNRDWGPFKHPETQAVKALLDDLISSGAVPILLLDFHATRETVLYTPPEDNDLYPEQLTTKWMQQMQKSGVKPPRRQGASNPHLPTAKSWFPVTYSAPGITVEFADEMDREQLQITASMLADTLSDVLLALDDEAIMNDLSK